jgi:hypothetical protein
MTAPGFGDDVEFEHRARATGTPVASAIAFPICPRLAAR